jgi:addiction module HigA family antidote
MLIISNLQESQAASKKSWLYLLNPKSNIRNPKLKNYAKESTTPVTPRGILKEMFIAERGLTITEVAKGLNMARANLSSVINGHLGISPELAVKLSEAFGNSAIAPYLAITWW